MDKRTKILAIGFGAAFAFVVLSQVVYPTWVRPIFTLDERIDERKAELDKLEKMQQDVEDARNEYRDYVARIGSFDPGQVETAIRDRLNALIEKYKLENASVSPARPVEDRKTGLITTVITVGATGSLEAAVSFMKEVSELPQLVRVGNPALSPSGSGKKAAEQDVVNLRLPIEVLVLPRNQIVGAIEPAALPKTDLYVRHDAIRDYSDIWNRKPFIPFIEYPPLRVDTQKMVNVEVGQPAILQAIASGGNGEYKFEWTPSEGLTEPNQARTVADSSAPRTQTYTVTVTDTIKDHSPVSASVVLTVSEAKVAKVEPPRPPPPPPPQPDTWPEGKNMQIVMTLMRSSGSNRTNELMVHNTRTKETTYHKVTEDFDGGKLLFVHQTGAVVGRKGKYYVYPLGTMLSEAVEYQNADSYPELKAAAERAVALQTARAEARKNSPPVPAASVEAQPGGTPPVQDSRGAEPANPESQEAQPNQPESTGPVVPVLETPSADAVKEPPEPSVPEPTQPAQAQPNPAGSVPQPTNRPTPGSRPRPTKGKKPGRL